VTDLLASWRMPTGKRMEKMAAALDNKAPLTPAMAPEDDLPAEHWQALDIRSSGSSIAALRLSEISHHLLRVGCRRCSRTVEMHRL
jgi:hypothetical protein